MLAQMRPHNSIRMFAMLWICRRTRMLGGNYITRGRDNLLVPANIVILPYPLSDINLYTLSRPWKKKLINQVEQPHLSSVCEVQNWRKLTCNSKVRALISKSWIVELSRALIVGFVKIVDVWIQIKHHIPGTYFLFQGYRRIVIASINLLTH